MGIFRLSNCKNETGEEVKIRYKDTWNKGLIENYFEKDDQFVKFMNLTYDNKIEEALKMKQKVD
ncbi:hypothetical protein K8R66_01710 [bacterium]|nr:hypothetical protein [bacterium]